MLSNRRTLIAQLSETVATMPVANLEVLNDLLSELANLPLSQSQRALALRPSIVRNLARLVLTDDERGNSLQLPIDTRIRENAKILSPENLKIGENTWVGEGAILDASGGLEIGSHTSIGPGVFVWSHSSHLANLNFESEISSRHIQRTPTKIGNGVFIAGPSVVLAGTTIGDKCIIRPMSVVSGDIPDYSIVDGSSVKKGVLSEAAIASLTSELAE